MTPVRTALALFTATAAVQIVVPSVVAAQAITPAGYAGGTYGQNFDTLPVRSPINTLTGTVFFADVAGIPRPVALTDPLLYAPAATPSGALAGWGFSRATGLGTGVNFTWGNGSGNGGAAYNLGANDSTDRAFGALGSGTQAARLGLALVNNTANIFNSFSLGFTTEQWRTSTTLQNTLAFGFRTGVNSNALFVDPHAAAPAFNAVGFAPVAVAGAVDGDSAANKRVTAPTVFSGGGFLWLPGETLVLSWTDTNDTGADAALGIDDVTFSAIFNAYQPKNLTWTGATDRNWNTSTANWSDDATVYSEGLAGSAIIGDNVTFTAAGAGTVDIQAGGVRPSAVVINSNSDYTFSGGPIAGTGAIVKTGSGRLVLASANTLAGGIQINGGTLEYSNDNQLGGGTLSVTELSTIRATAPITSTRTVGFSGAGGTFDTGANTVTIGQLNVGVVASQALTVFVKNGSGNLSVGGVFTAFGSVFNINAGTLTIRGAGGTNSIGASGGNEFAGNIVLDGHQTLQVAAADGESRFIGGGGTITVGGAGRTGTAAFSGSNTSSISVVRGEVTLLNNVVVNPDNNPGFRLNLGASAGGGFISNFNINSTISGNTDVNFSDGVSAGAGVVTVNTPLAHTGSTSVNFGPNGVVRLGTSDAFPAGTALIFGDGFNRSATGALDLNGRNLSVASLESIRLPNGTNAPQPSFIAGIVNGSSNPSLLTITGSSTTTYAGGIGTVISSNVFTPSTNIGVTLAASHTGHLTLTGAAGTFNYTGDTTVNGGGLTFGRQYRPVTATLSVSGTGQVVSAPAGYEAGQPRVAIDVAAINLAGSGKLTVAPAARAGGANDQATVVTSALSIAPGAFFDLGNNDLIVRGGNLAALRAAVRAWYVADAGLPGAVGLGSSTAFYTADGAFATLAVYDNTGGSISTFNGVAVGSGDVLVKYTYLGDTNIDGVVDASDLARVLQGLNGGGTGWNFGDVNYDGVVNSFDLGRVQAAIRGQGAPLGNALGGTGVGGVIPEPSSLGLLALALPLVSRRRRA